MNPNQKFQQLYSEVSSEFKDKIQGIQTASNHFKTLYESVIRKLDSHFRVTCGKQMEWMDANTEETQNGPQLKSTTKQEDFDRTINELKDCVKQNDPIQSQDTLVEFDETMHQMSNKYGGLFRKCTELKDDGKIKDCFRNLIGENLQEMDRFYHSFEQRFEEINKKI